MSASTVTKHSLIPEEATAENRVLNVLKGGGEEMMPSELVRRVQAEFPDLSDIDVKRAIWNLIASSRIYLSPEQLLSVVSREDQTKVA
jgi:hypothetical protein